MSWLFGKKDKASEHQKLRAKQVEEFIKYNPAALPLDPNKTKFQLGINTQFGQLPFQVILGPGFPEQPPVLQLLARVQHRWVNKNMNVVGHPKLLAWSPHHHLGKIVREIYQEFQRNPPQPVRGGAQAKPPQQPRPQQGYPMQHHPAQPRMGSGSVVQGNRVVHGQVPVMVGVPQQQQQQQQAYQHQQQQLQQQQQRLQQQQQQQQLQQQPQAQPQKQSQPEQPPEHPARDVRTPQPAIPEVFPELEALSIEQLEALMNDPTRVMDMMEGMESVKSMEDVRRGLWKAIDEQAELNLEKKQESLKLQAEVDAMQLELQQERAKLAGLVTRQQAVLQRYSVGNVLERLDSAIGEADQASDDLKRSYERGEDSDDEDAGSMSHTKFCKEYTKKRELVHRRQAQKERLAVLYGAT